MRDKGAWFGVCCHELCRGIGLGAACMTCCTSSAAESDITKCKTFPRPQASVWKPTCRYGKDYQAIIPARQPRPAGACDDPRMGVRGPDEAAAKLLARTVEKAAADALPPDAVQVCRVTRSQCLGPDHKTSVRFRSCWDR